MMLSRKFRILLVLCLTLLVGTVTFMFTSSDGLSFQSAQLFINPIPDQQKISASSFTRVPPTLIQIPRLNKSLPVTASLVQNNEWELYDNAVSWLSTSAVPGEGENVILYAHDTPELFGDLNQLAVGDWIKLTQDQQIATYNVREIKEVKPTDIDEVVLKADQLTLYTCQGSYNQKRLVVYATPL